MDFDLATATGARAVILVEGASDQAALEALAERRGRVLGAHGVAIVPMGAAIATASPGTFRPVTRRSLSVRFSSGMDSPRPVRLARAHQHPNTALRHPSRHPAADPRPKGVAVTAPGGRPGVFAALLATAWEDAGSAN